MTLNREYEKAIAAMADDVMEYYGFYASDSYVSNFVVDVPGDRLVYVIDLIESGLLQMPATPGTSVDKLIAEYRGQHNNATYIPVVEKYIDDTWEHVLNPDQSAAVEAAIRQGGHDNSVALFGGEYEARKAFISAVCARVADYIREMVTTR